jgi:hypothetical protein
VAGEHFPATWCCTSLLPPTEAWRPRFGCATESGDTLRPQTEIWAVPGRPGVRLIGYDNERGKGNHRHIEGGEEPYAFTTPDALIQDFLADMRKLRGES